MDIGLANSTTYHFRLKAENIGGVSYGNDMSFSTRGGPITFNPNLTYQWVSDIDGNIYKTIQIADQTWMAENLKTTKYNDGINIIQEVSLVRWATMQQPFYCWYDNDLNLYKSTYGALYNGYCVSTGKLCPTGWSVPTEADWQTLITNLGGSSVAGGKLKETGTSHWLSPNTGATNQSGFTALPGGFRYILFTEANYIMMWNSGYFWSSDVTKGMKIDYEWGSCGISSGTIEINSGLSVRCIKNK
jgi:uncharacterized protein (TIGR02145 family)